MNIIATNNTDTILTIADLGISLLPDQSIDLALSIPLYKISNSDNLALEISNNNISINDGVDDLNISDAIRYITTLKTTSPTDPSGKLRVHQTSRQVGLTTYFTGCDDDITNINDVGNGEIFALDHHIGDSTNEYVYMDLNIADNETWIHEGYIIWKDADFDLVSLEVVPVVATIEEGQSTNYTLYGGYLVVPSDGTHGDINITSDLTNPRGGLVYMPPSDEGVKPVAFWNATWDSYNKCYTDITSAPLGNGEYNIFTQEVILSRFVNRVPLLGDGFQHLKTSDVSELGQGMRLRCYAETNGDHDWKVSYVITFHRKRTI